MKTHILSNQEKYLSLEAHININICLFINSPQESTVEFGIFYFEVVSHVIHVLQLLNNDCDIACNEKCLFAKKKTQFVFPHCKWLAALQWM